MRGAAPAREMSAIQRTLKIRPDETSLVLSMCALSFVGMAGLAIGQSGANALFFDRIGTDALPLIYLAQGATAFVFMMGLAALLGRVDRRRAYLAIPAGLGAVVVAERLALLTDGRWIFPVLWLTVALAVLLQNVFVWGTAGVVTDTRRAKRLFPLFAAGEILGSVLGGLLTNPLVRLIGTENLLLVWAAALATSWGLCRVVLSAAGTRAQPRIRKARRADATPWRDLAVAFGYVRRSRLLVWMTLAAVLFSVLFFSLYLPWATAATERFPDAGDLAGFFGLFWAAMTGAAFLVSVLVTNRLFARFGIATMMLVLPLLYVGSFGILLVSAGFVTLVVLRFVDGVWLQGVASPAWETLTNVVPDARRDQVRTFLNGGPAQAGTAIAGIIALVGQDVLSPRQFAAIGLASAALAVFVVWRVRASYASALVEALREGRPEVFPDVAVAGVPFAFAPDAQAIGTLLLAMVAVISRYRRGDRVVRLQIRWFVAAVAILPVSLLGILVELGLRAAGAFDGQADAPNGLAFAIVSDVGILALPIAIGIAVTRYRLYEIDRLISRTIGWALVTGVLLAVFGGTVIGLQAVLDRVMQGQTLAVAASTLIAFALFQPVRRRVQHLVDRRFDRARYDGDRTAAAFAERLREQVDLAGLEADFTGVVDVALRPRSVGVWIRRPGHRGAA